MKKGKYTKISRDSGKPPQIQTPGQGTSPVHGGDMLSLNNVPQPGHPMTQLMANDYPQGDS